MPSYDGRKLIKTNAKNGGKNHSLIDGFYRDTLRNEYFIKKPADQKELFTELFAGLILRELMDRGLVDEKLHSSLICADVIEFSDGSYGLIQSKVNFTELYKIIGTRNFDNSDRDPLKEIWNGQFYYQSLAQQNTLGGLSTALFFSLFLSAYSVHSGNIVALNTESGDKQFARIDWGDAFRYFAAAKNNENALLPAEYAGILNIKRLTKAYIQNYRHITGLFSSIAHIAKQLESNLNIAQLTDIVVCALQKIPHDMLDHKTKLELANYMVMPAFANIDFKNKENIEQIALTFAKVLKKRLKIIGNLVEDPIVHHTAFCPNEPVKFTSGPNSFSKQIPYLAQMELIKLEALQQAYGGILDAITREYLLNDKTPFELETEYLPDKYNGSISRYQEELSYLKELSVFVDAVTLEEKFKAFTQLANVFEKLLFPSESIKQSFKQQQYKIDAYNCLITNKCVTPEFSAFNIDRILDYLNARDDSFAATADVMKDDVFWFALQAAGDELISAAQIHDCLVLKKFHDEKIQLNENNKYGDEYSTSLNQFYEISLQIRLSSAPADEQADALIKNARAEFSHRHGRHRFVADIAMMVGTFFGGLGICVGVARVLMNKSFFFSKSATDRENAFTDLLGNELFKSKI